MPAPPAAKRAPRWKACKREGEARAHAALPPSPTNARAGTRAAPPPPARSPNSTRRHDELGGELAGAEAVPAADRRQAQRAAGRHRHGRSRAQRSRRRPRRRPRAVLAEADKHAKAADAALSAAREERARAQALSESAASPHRGIAHPHPRRAGMPRRKNWPNAPRSRTARNCRRWNRPKSGSSG